MLRAYMGLGKAGTKEANKLLICEQVEQRRNVLTSNPEPCELDEDSFADEPSPKFAVNSRHAGF